MPAICFASGRPAHLVDLSTRHYPGLRGEGWIPVPLPPPACRRSWLSRRSNGQLSPVTLAISSLIFGPRSPGPACYSLKDPFVSEALDFADSVRFSKFERFEMLTNLRGEKFCGFSRTTNVRTAGQVGAH
jgi:hypothetical protein